MTDSVQPHSKSVLTATFLSIIPGLGQIYLRQIFKGLVLILSVVVAIFIIWFALSNKEVKLLDLGQRQIMFNPSAKDVHIFGQRVGINEIMKITGTIQLIFTWLFSIFDARKEARKSTNLGTMIK
jgi:hypothetical protein